MSGAVEIFRVAGVATIQDRGRPGHLHEGVPAGGALVPELLARANAAVGNAADAAGIELTGSMVLTARGGTLVVATEDGVIHSVLDGASLAIDPHRDLRVRYVAIRGGLDVPRVLGGRGTLLVASLGGHEGRPLRRGDRIPIGASDASAPLSSPATFEPLDLAAPIRVVLGPDLARFAPNAPHVLTNAPFTLSPSSDRTGSRLIGPRLMRLDGDDARSAPMVPGAIEVTATGDAIVLGPDHPTTGGYPILAVVVVADLGRFHARPIGVPVRFVAT